MCHKRIKSCLLFSVFLFCNITVRDLENKERKKERKKDREIGGRCVCGLMVPTCTAIFHNKPKLRSTSAASVNCIY